MCLSTYDMYTTLLLYICDTPINIFNRCETSIYISMYSYSVAYGFQYITGDVSRCTWSHRVNISKKIC